ncbi:MAG TPA: hypothetical protein VK666_15380 [Chryseolinea sp.]|nr:hypothetical protein [Chryseolinea sp.]
MVYAMGFINSIFNILRFNKKNWKAVVLCVFTASIFWCFNALNKRYTTTLSFPLTFDYDREHFIPIRPLPQFVRINVTGIGWNLFRRGAGVKVPPLVIPLERPADVRKIVGSTLPGLFANQLGGFEVNFVITDTLHLAVEPKGKRRIKVEPDIAGIIFRKGYARTSLVTVTPDSVLVDGPVKLVTSLPNPFNVKIPQRNIDESYNEMVELKFLNDELIGREPLAVNITFDVDKLTEVSDSVKLTVINAPKQALQVIERKRLACTVAIPEGSLDTFSLDSVKAVLDLKNLTRGVKKIFPTLKGLPPYSEVVRLDSVVIKF